MDPAFEALEQRVFAIERPKPQLLTLYLLYAGLTTVAAPIVFIPLYFRYHTLRFRFDAQGIGVSYGILFRRETYLTYARIQDIHLTRNLFERWLGIGTVEIQTASGSGSAEITVPGTDQFEPIRDYLYARMRGAREHVEPTLAAPPEGEAGAPPPAGLPPRVAATGEERVAAALHEVAASLRETASALRQARPS